MVKMLIRSISAVRLPKRLNASVMKGAPTSTPIA
jgi:hypothetical protein